MSYTQSVLYAKSGGGGKHSSLAIVLMTAALFVYGPMISSFIPRCMAGTLLLHIGIDLFLEGVYDSFNKFDNLEYSGIWFITIVMATKGMSAALVAGVISALSTYAVQSMTHINPIRGSMSAATLRSSVFNRSPEASAILDHNSTGRSKILVIQMQGHLFFGNVALFTDRIKELLAEKQGSSDCPWIVIMDFTLVMGLDSSAAHSIGKLKQTLHQMFRIKIVFVTGSSTGFPCEYALRKELESSVENVEPSFDQKDRSTSDESTVLLPLAANFGSRNNPDGRVFDCLDSALRFCEGTLIAWKDPTIVNNGEIKFVDVASSISNAGEWSLADEQKIAVGYLANLCQGEESDDDMKELFSFFDREVYFESDVLWKQGDKSNCTKLLIRGNLLSLLENEAGSTEPIQSGNLIGELGLLLDTDEQALCGVSQKKQFFTV
eukprot:CAMPEP_0171301486 /NCGR_PEP_ID=MMETSP0816-20121228/10706_1 /TAXON_ID=420281 /ORGANISM="Proboscia inermis, Strain CCAP1064/1" /LENGTH=434 /DNA_ID=CAMNT_0011779143 /DNA_START=213 /DNA_END=1518 /DNA_ORIENTATION=+